MDGHTQDRSKLEEALATARRNCAAATEAAREAADGGAETAELRRQVDSERAAASAAASNYAAREQRLQVYTLRHPLSCMQHVTLCHTHCPSPPATSSLNEWRPTNPTDSLRRVNDPCRRSWRSCMRSSILSRR